jgi:hypothetical protein
MMATWKPAAPTFSIASIEKTKDVPENRGKKAQDHVPEADDLIAGAAKLGLDLCCGLKKMYCARVLRQSTAVFMRPTLRAVAARL